MDAEVSLFIDCRCELGEGAFWHHIKQRLFWFDIHKNTLFCADADGNIEDHFTFIDHVSAAGIIDEDRLLVAQAGALLEFSTSKRVSRVVAPLDLDHHGNRSNDGRVSRAGGFWIGTMSKEEDPELCVGSLYHYREGELSKLASGIRIPNATCFSPDGTRAYFTDHGKIMTCTTDPSTGLPTGKWTKFEDTEGYGWADGAVVDSEGFIWNARWKGSAVIRFTPDGRIDRIVKLPVSRVTCPSFGGKDLKTLYITTGRTRMTPEELESEPNAGSLFSMSIDVPGLPECLVKV